MTGHPPDRFVLSFPTAAKRPIGNPARCRLSLEHFGRPNSRDDTLRVDAGVGGMSRTRLPPLPNGGSRADRMPTGPWIAGERLTAPGNLSGPVHLPDRDLAAYVLPQDVGKAVAVEVARSDRMPARPGIGAHGPAADHVRSVHLPDRGLPGARVLEQDVRVTVVVEVAGSDRLPARPGVDADRPAANHAGPVHFPDRALAAARILEQDVGMAVAVEIAGPDRVPAWTRVRGKDRAAAGNLRGPVHFPDRDLPGARIPPQDVGEAVAVEVAGPDRMPAGSRNGAHGPAADHIGPVHFPDRGLAVARVLQKDVGMPVAIEVAGSDVGPAGPRIGAGRTAPDHIRSVHFPDRGLSARALQENVGQGVAIEIGGDRRADRGDAAALGDEAVDHAMVGEAAAEHDFAAEHIQLPVVDEV